MENASKALIIAGAILLSILIIAIGMFIYNKSQSSVMGAGDALSQYEIDQFNATWEAYDGDQPGSNVKTLISKLISNAKSYAEEETKLPDLSIQAKSSSSVYNVNSTAGATGVEGFTKARTDVEARHTYTVKIGYDSATSLVNQITIEY